MDDETQSGLTQRQPTVRRRSSRRRRSFYPTSESADAGDVVEALEEPVRGELDGFVPPLRRAVDARNQTGAMHATEVAVDERIAGLRLIVCAFGEAEVPGRVFIPRMGLEERVLICRTRLPSAPVAAEDVLPSVDQSPSVRDRALVDRIARHREDVPTRAIRHTQGVRVMRFGFATSRWSRPPRLMLQLVDERDPPRGPRIRRRRRCHHA